MSTSGDQRKERTPWMETVKGGSPMSWKLSWPWSESCVDSGKKEEVHSLMGAFMR